jgi:hypothetical protein
VRTWNLTCFVCLSAGIFLRVFMTTACHTDAYYTIAILCCYPLSVGKWMEFEGIETRATVVR